MDLSQTDDCEEKRFVHIAVHGKKKHTLEMRATKLTYNQTACLCFQQQRRCVGGTTLCDKILLVFT